jgi:hypothetical protein
MFAITDGFVKFYAFMLGSLLGVCSCGFLLDLVSHLSFFTHNLLIGKGLAGTAALYIGYGSHNFVINKLS